MDLLERIEIRKEVMGRKGVCPWHADRRAYFAEFHGSGRY